KEVVEVVGCLKRVDPHSAQIYPQSQMILDTCYVSNQKLYLAAESLDHVKHGEKWSPSDLTRRPHQFIHMSIAVCGEIAHRGCIFPPMRTKHV
ncbi:MAG: hypothetical protein AAF220_05660, partial [Pseudomonadota bacterium]